jgi:site-specific DNA recombinase
MPSTNGHGPEPERAALYLRVSSEEQRDRETIEIQDDFLEQYRSLYELEVAEIYKDDGISGTIPLHERPEGRRLLEDAKEGKFQTVLVYRLDRLGRSLLVIVDAHDRLQSAGVSLRSATEPIDTSNPSGRLIFQMLASFAEYERETIGERTRAGLHRAFRNGKHAGRIPYGYRLSADEVSLEVVPDESEIVRGIIANIADGSSLYGESKRLNDEGIPSPGWRFKSGERKHGLSWSPSTVATIIHNRAYGGVHEVKTAKGVIERPCPPLLDPALQRRAEAALQANKHRASAQRKKARRYLLSGLVVCETCGRACSGHTATRRGKQYVYYHCTAANRPELGAYAAPAHKAPRADAQWLEGLVWSDVRSFLENPGEVLDRVREQFEDDGRRAGLEERRAFLRKRLTEAEQEKKQLLYYARKGTVTEDELAEELPDLRNTIENLRLMIASVENDLAAHDENQIAAENAAAWLVSLRERIEEVEGDTPEAFYKRQQLVRLLVERVMLTRGEDGKTTVQVTYRFGPPTDTDNEHDVSANIQYSEEFPKERKKR